MTETTTARTPPVVAWLGYGGLIPFVGLTVAALADRAARAWLIQAALAYAAVILSFVGALHWGFAMSLPHLDSRLQRRLFVWSVVPSLLAWALLLLPPVASGVGFVIAFLLHWLRDLSLARQVTLPRWYLPLRLRLTAVAILCVSVNCVTT